MAEVLLGQKKSITLIGTCSDTGGSGCRANIKKYFSSDINTTNQSPGTVSDNAGNTTSCPADQTVKIDKTAPKCTSSGGSSSWTNKDKTITGTCSDGSGSGCTGNVTKTYTTNTNTTTASPGTVKDNVGNTTTCPANQTVKIDKTAPKCTSSGGSTSWKKTNVTLKGTCSDTGGSGCTGNVTKDYTDDTNVANQSPGTVKDNAGNTATCPANQTVKIDKTAPTCTSSGGSNNWTNGIVTLVGTCSDNLSGCTTNKVTISFSSNTNITNRSPGTVRDNAGNTATCPANQTVKVDTTAPKCTSSGGSSSWTNKNITLVGTCSDTGGSGCIGNVTQTYVDNTNLTNQSPGTVYDNAGNKATCPADQTVKIDKNAPTCKSSGGSTSWTTNNITLIGTCSDTGGSGCTGNVSKIFSSQGEWYNQSPGTVRDNAGNTATCPADQTVKITGPPTAPTINLNGYTSGSWTNKNVTITMSSTSQVGIDHYEYSHWSDAGWNNDFDVNPSGWQRVYNNSDRSKMSVTISWDGSWDFYIRAVDKNGVPSEPSKVFTVRVDKTAPTCVSSGGSSSWTSGSRTIKGTCSDTGGSGCTGNVSRTYSTPGEWYNQSPGTVRDNAGNTKICPNNQTIRIAGPPSRPTINLNGYTSATWTNQNVTITMSSSSNIGIDHYEYSHDGTNWINDFNNNPTGWQRVYHNNNKTSMSVTISWEGNWNFYIRAVDKNGNVSPNSIMFTVRIDKTPPVVILNKVNILQTNSSGAWINFFFLQGGQCNYALCQNSVFDSWQLVNVVGSLGMSFEMTQTDNLSGVIANTGSYNWDMYDLDKNIYISSCLSSQGNRRCRWTQRYTVRDAAGNTSNTATAIVYMHYP